MTIGYQTERLHHALHPLFLNLLPGALWRVGEDYEDCEWYIGETEECYILQHRQEQWRQDKDLYAVKRFIYDYFEREYQLSLPWGIISGIRPTKLTAQMMAKCPSTDSESFREQIWSKYRVSAQKAEMLWDVYQTEQEYLGRSQGKSGMHLYIGIPYCPSRCYYCSFASAVVKEEQDERLERYVELLRQELILLREVIGNHRIRTIYLGGGTPTILSNQFLDRLCGYLAEEVVLQSLEEFTVEAGRPDTITAEKLQTLKKYGVNRVSINPQTFSDKTLAAIGRNHSVEEVFQTFAMARELGFLINMDLIFGLKGETGQDVELSFREITRLRPDNITVHTLTAKRGADLSQGDRAEMAAVGLDIGWMIDFCRKGMKDHGYRPYYLYRQKNIYFENVGYSLPGRECIYNMETMLERESILAIGAGAISKKIGKNKITRHENPKQFEAYLKVLEQKCIEKKKLFAQYE